MLKYRLIFGTLMTVFFTAVVVLDGWLDGSLSLSAQDKAVQGTLFCILIVFLVAASQIELSKLIEKKNLRIFRPVVISASILLATSWYWPQIFEISLSAYVFFVLAFTLFALFFYQYFRYGVSAVVANCGANVFSIIYIGLLSSFAPALRIDFGLWPLLMFVFVVKAADIGAYTAGSLFGKHSFSPNISPKKTWEGMAGAVIAAVIVAVFFADCCIMSRALAVLFGICFAFIGQFGDLAESLIKRSAEQKDSAAPRGLAVPGFGGILDVIDSPLAAASFAYLFFAIIR
jgi:phosphatidate cytidylyltransferase